MSNIKEPEETRWAYPERAFGVGVLFGSFFCLYIGLGIWMIFGFDLTEDIWDILQNYLRGLLFIAGYLLFSMRRLLQKVRLDEGGISSYLFGKEVCRFSWEEVEDIGLATMSRMAENIPLMYFTNKTFASYWKDRHQKFPPKNSFSFAFVTVRKRPKTARRLIALEYNEKNKAELDQYVAEWRKQRYYLDEKYSDET